MRLRRQPARSGTTPRHPASGAPPVRRRSTSRRGHRHRPGRDCAICRQVRNRQLYVLRKAAVGYGAARLGFLRSASRARPRGIRRGLVGSPVALLKSLFLPVSSRFALIRVHLRQKRRLFMDSRLVRIFCANSPSQKARGESYNLLLSLRKGYLFRHRSWCYRLSSSSTSPESIKSLKNSER